MKINELIRYVKGQKKASPVCAFDDEMICIWINEIEGMVQSEILLLSPADTIVYSLPDDGEKELLVPAPHSKIYRAYVCAMMEFSGGEYSRYDNTMALFNQWWNEYAAWYAQNIDPASGKGEFKGYYVSAYAIAVKHGYKGSEEEWLSELDLRVKAAEKHADDSAAAAASAMVAVTKYPVIGEDGYWKVWDTVSGEYVSTGIKAEGKDGTNGKSAYEYAVEGGYDESEETFYGDLAKESIPADIASLTSVRGMANDIVFPLADTTGTLRKITWSRFSDEIKKLVSPETAAAITAAFETTIASASYAVSDSRGVYYAFLPDGMKEDGVLVLQSDLEGYYSKADKAQMIADILSALPTWEGGRY